MKYLLGMVLGLGVTFSGAFAQSYLIRPNGVVLTIDAKGFMYNLNQFILPYMVTAKGGQFYINDKRQITTIDENGFFYRIDKDEFEAPRKVDFSGANYFSDKDSVWTIDRKGVIYRNEEIQDLGRVDKTGGRFFTIKPRRGDSLLYTVSDFGKIERMIVDGLNPNDIVVAGGTWFLSSKGDLYTLDSTGLVSRYDGSFFPRGTKIVKVGGNYLFTNRGLLTINELGNISLVTLGAAQPQSIGFNYFTLSDNSLFVVDHLGAVWKNEAFGNLGSLGMTSL
jgi:hypothetical protein